MTTHSVVVLECLDENYAKIVMEQVQKDMDARPEDPVHVAHREGARIVIQYENKMWPYNIADFAGHNGYASDSASGRVFASL